MIKPILFNTEMVQAILEGRKTVTRRVIKWKPYHDGEKINFNFSGMSLGNYCTGAPESGCVLYSRGGGGCWNQKTKPIIPPYQTGDVLWVRETWKILDVLENASMRFEYLAGGKVSDAISVSASRLKKILKFLNKKGWLPSLFMPREAARIFLKVKSVRAERLNVMTEKDALSEGVARHGLYNEQCYAGGCYNGDFETSCKVCEVPINGFEKLWNSTIKPADLARYGWDANPWVWVIEFERAEKPEDFA